MVFLRAGRVGWQSTPVRLARPELRLLLVPSEVCVLDECPATESDATATGSFALPSATPVSESAGAQSSTASPPIADCSIVPSSLSVPPSAHSVAPSAQAASSSTAVAKATPAHQLQPRAVLSNHLRHVRRPRRNGHDDQRVQLCCSAARTPLRLRWFRARGALPRSLRCQLFFRLAHADPERLLCRPQPLRSPCHTPLRDSPVRDTPCWPPIPVRRK